MLTQEISDEREREIAFLAGQHKKKRQKDVAKR